MFLVPLSLSHVNCKFSVSAEIDWNTTLPLHLHCLSVTQNIIFVFRGHLSLHALKHIYTPYLSLAKTMTSLKRNRCLSLVFEPSVTWTHSSSSSSPFSLVRPRTKGLCSNDTQQEASSLRTHRQNEGWWKEEFWSFDQKENNSNHIYNTV